MKANNKNFKNIENNNIRNQIKSNLINNIPNTQVKNNNSKKQIKNKRAINYFTINNNNQNYNSKTINIKENIFSGKKIFDHISINNSLLLAAYENSLLILFDSLKSYMKNDLQFFNNLKESFINTLFSNYIKIIIKNSIKFKNVQNFYQKNKFKLSKIIPNTKNNTFHKKNNSHLNFIINQSSRKTLLCLSNNSLSKSNTSIQTLNNNLPQNNTNKKINRITHKKSLYTLMKGSNRTPSSNNAIKNLIKKDYNYNLSILKSFIEFNKNNRTKTKKNDFGNKTNQDINKINNYSQNINSNEIINKIPNVIEKNEEETKDNNLIACIKNSLDDNLKNMFDFSYQSFLNKESEREG